MVNWDVTFTGVGTFIVTAGGAFVLWYMKLRKQASDITTIDRRTTAEIRRDDMRAQSEVESAAHIRLQEQYEKYFRRQDEDAAQLRKMVDDCREDCERREKEWEKKYEVVAREWERKHDLLARENQRLERTLSKLLGWFSAARTRIKKVTGLDLPLLDDSSGSGIHEPLPPTPDEAPS